MLSISKFYGSMYISVIVLLEMFSFLKNTNSFSSFISYASKFPLISSCVKFLKSLISLISVAFLSLNLNCMNIYGFLTSDKDFTFPNIVVDDVFRTLSLELQDLA